MDVTETVAIILVGIAAIVTIARALVGGLREIVKEVAALKADLTQKVVETQEDLATNTAITKNVQTQTNGTLRQLTERIIALTAERAGLTKRLHETADQLAYIVTKDPAALQGFTPRRSMQEVDDATE
jgi:Sec-independent protein translocase protein TatA